MSDASAPIYLHYTLTLRSPVIVTTLSGDPNSAATQPFIPGSAVRGAIAARLLGRGIGSDSAEFRQLVLTSDVRYLHAYPQVTGARGLPTLSSWRRQKDEPETAHDLAALSGNVPDDPDFADFATIWPEEALTSVGEPFVATSASGGQRAVRRPLIDARLHQQRDRVKGRPWTERKDGAEQAHGVIFAYEYLDAGQVFQGIVQVLPEASALIERIKTLLADPILVGRSRRAGYGGEAEIAFTADTTREYESAAGALSQDITAGQHFRALLTSAYVGRHPTSGQIDPLALEPELRARLGDVASIERRRWSFETVGGFNQKWRLEIPQSLAVAGGAVLVLKANRSISLDTLRRIEHEGLGERRVDGFGRVLFLAHTEGNQTVRLNREEQRMVEEKDGATANMPEAVSNELAFLERRIALAAARTELERTASADLASKVKLSDIPTNSLLGRLRAVLRSAQDTETANTALQTLATWCSNDSADALKEPARKQLDKCGVGNKDLRSWLRDLASPPDGTARWQALVQASGNATTLTGLAQRHHLVSQSDAQGVLDTHAALLSVQLADSLLAALARRNRGG